MKPFGDWLRDFGKDPDEPEEIWEIEITPPKNPRPEDTITTPLGTKKSVQCHACKSWFYPNFYFDDESIKYFCICCRLGDHP